MPQSLTEQLSRDQQIAALEKDWATNPRWKGIKRGYTAAEVVRLRGSFPIEYTLARRGAEKLWDLVNNEAYVNCLGALTGGQAMQQVKAGTFDSPKPKRRLVSRRRKCVSYRGICADPCLVSSSHGRNFHFI